MNTYRRFTCVNRSINFFLNQDANTEKELIIYNTDLEYPLVLDPELQNYNITIVNNNTDYITGSPYTNIGSIRRDSLQHATGTHYICWDDDDIFLPWHIRQCVDGYEKNPDIWAWKPHTSMFWKANHGPELACNNMEASILIDIAKLRECGFLNHQGGGEHLHWIDTFSKAKKFYIEKNSIPSYCFNWADTGEMRGHKQSGTIDRIDNFVYHKTNTTDYAKGPLTANVIIDNIIKIHIGVISSNVNKQLSNNYVIQADLFDKYCLPHIAI
jgi:hypothetical protein